MPFAEVNGQSIYFEDSGGNLPAIAFSHGFLMDHEMWEPQVQAFRDEFRCISWDERGFGQTRATKAFTYWDLADDLLALLTHLGIERAILVGMSQGGFLSLRAALEAPERVLGLGLVDTQAGLEEEAIRPTYDLTAREWIAHGPDDIAESVAAILLSPGYDPTTWISKWKTWPREEMSFSYEALMGRGDITDRLPEITCPAIVLHGERDAAIPIEKAQALSNGLARCEGLIKIPDAGHASNLSHPDQVNEPLREFCRKHARPSAAASTPA
jgi:3-oxoadipate enol-lactonase